MPDLHLIGVHEDGRHLLLSGAGAHGGEEFMLPIDDALRAVLRRDYAAHRTTTEPMRPTEVQAMIRAGASAQEAAERAGWSVEKVHRYEGPILAERAHIARIAGDAHVPSHTGNPVSLADRVEQRLEQRGVPGDEVEWDSWRSEDGQWTVELTFPAGGRRRLAAWHFSRSAMTVSPVDDEARWLSGDDVPEAPLPPSRPARAARPARGPASPGGADAAEDSAHDGGYEDTGSAPQGAPEPEPRGLRGAPDPDSELTAGLRERAAQRARRRPRRLPRAAGLHSAPGPVVGGRASAAVEEPTHVPAGPAASATPAAPTIPADDASGPSPTAIPDVGLAPDPDAVPLEPFDYDPHRDGLPPAAHADPDEQLDALPEPVGLEPATEAASSETPEPFAGSDNAGDLGDSGDPDEVARVIEAIEAEESVGVIEVPDVAEAVVADEVLDDTEGGEVLAAMEVVEAEVVEPEVVEAEVVEAQVIDAEVVGESDDAVEITEVVEITEAVESADVIAVVVETEPEASQAPGPEEPVARQPDVIEAVEVTAAPEAPHADRPAAASHSEPELPLGSDEPARPSASEKPNEPSGSSEEAAAPPAKPAAAPRTRRRTRSTSARRTAETPAAAPEQASEPEQSSKAETDAPAPKPTPPSSTPKQAAPRGARQGQGSRQSGTRQTGRKGRASVPAWDDIMFGAKPPAE